MNTIPNFSDVKRIYSKVSVQSKRYNRFIHSAEFREWYVELSNSLIK